MEQTLSDHFYKWVRQNQDPSLTLKIEKKWSSTYTDNRLLIRKDLFKKFNVPAILNLDDFPKNLDQNVSISHCPVFGGYALSDRPVGLDIEQWQRISTPLVKRICDEAIEKNIIEKCPDDVAVLWSAKESAYKSLRRAEGQISEIKIRTFEKVASERSSLWFYKIKCEYQKQTIKCFGFIDEEIDLVGALSYPITL